MTEPSEVLIRVDDEVMFRLLKGRYPLTYPDMVCRVSYESGIKVLHAGTVWAVGLIDGVQVLELDDSTVVAGHDIDPESVVVRPAAEVAP